MVKIVKGDLVNFVPNASFNNFFKSQGWTLAEGEEISPKPISAKKEKVEEKPVEEISVVEEPVEEEINEEDWDEVIDELVDEEVEKPISEMNKEELIKKAKKLGIATDGLSNKQLREAIKSHK